MEEYIDLQCLVTWDDIDFSYEEEERCRSILQKSVLGYVKTFKSIPPVGLFIHDGEHSCGKIKEIAYNGIDNKICVHLDFDLDYVGWLR